MHPLPSTYLNSRFLKGKQLFNINHIVYTNSLGLVRHSSHIMKIFSKYRKLVTIQVLRFHSTYTVSRPF